MAAKKAAKKATKKAAKKPAPRKDKGEGGAAVKAWIAHAKPQHRALAQRLDEIITEELPGARKAVKWGAPFYGLEGRGWVATFASFKAYVSLGFFAGASLKPEPPEGESGLMRRVKIVDGTEPDEKQIRAWLRQAAKLPGWGKV
ncbi:MAG: hypothetical protein QOE90_529 [Thermoplasmata archaeon]|jgi:hypothetical protein|nr:hypothetical protein [Thermoplasmata archaeon]